MTPRPVAITPFAVTRTAFPGIANNLGMIDFAGTTGSVERGGGVLDTVGDRKEEGMKGECESEHF